MRYLWLFLLFIPLANLFAQADGERMVTPLTWASASEMDYVSEPVAVRFRTAATPFIAAYVHLMGVPEAFLTHISVRASQDGARWSAWERAWVDPHISAYDTLATAPVFLDKNARYVQVSLSQYPVETAPNAVLYLFNPDMPEQDTPAPAPTPDADASALCPCPAPTILPRSAWNAPPLPATCQNPTTITHLVVHHSATSNTSGNWAATVLAIYNGHIQRGFCDVGYNFLIDPLGNVYEGRVNGSFLNITGAHFCAQNAGTMGVCMIGNYMSAPPMPVAVNRLERLLAWRACALGIAPTGASLHASSGLNLPHIIGHRDGCATECPGQLMYDRLNSVRQNVNACYSGTTDIPETIAAATGFALFPNPTETVFTVRFNGPTARIRVLDAIGRVLSDAAPVGDTYTFHTAGWVPGVYQVVAGGVVKSLILK
jgi:N-acetylmuramoyl-L-alanine amidase